nr:MAG TPA: hypothetical protein [Caudoviricetes sp.]
MLNHPSTCINYFDSLCILCEGVLRFSLSKRK